METANWKFFYCLFSAPLRFSPVYNDIVRWQLEIDTMRFTCIRCGKKFTRRMCIGATAKFCGRTCFSLSQRLTPSQQLEAGCKKDSSGCWLWTKSTVTGYGCLRINSKTMYAHRLSFELSKGPVADGMFICHRCNTRLCVNPAHLYMATCAENTLDAHRDGLCNGYYGVNNWTAKLDPEKIRAIRLAPRKKGYQTRLAQQFGVAQTTISQVITRKTWRQVI